MKGETLMKIELNPNRMTVAELNDCIAELTAQRDRLLEEECEAISGRCHDAVIEMLGKVWEFTDCGRIPWGVELYIKPTNGREHHIKLDMSSIQEWHIEVTKPAQ